MKESDSNSNHSLQTRQSLEPCRGLLKSATLFLHFALLMKFQAKASVSGPHMTKPEFKRDPNTG